MVCGYGLSSWEFKKVGARLEAEALSNNPGVDAGNGVWLFRKFYFPCVFFGFEILLCIS